jgi:hypothetical protein
MWLRPTLRLRNGPTLSRRRRPNEIARAEMKIVTNDVRRRNVAFSRTDTS